MREIKKPQKKLLLDDILSESEEPSPKLGTPLASQDDTLTLGELFNAKDSEPTATGRI